ncbi:DUF4397 domain-containing protein [Pontibacter beigongshangensis]|uniref:DUF4397 domain-containing protein n=1 Tax=Pontibacter beigongshangensis TaxID=2574733 RepID=UPI00165057BE|nr:DUF4397 domain-containing protein [Pontibacter beigongshangensis]
MQNPFKKTVFSRSALIFSSLLVSLFLSGCKDDERETPEPIPVSFVSFYNGSPAAQEFDYLLDESRINNRGIKYTDFSEYLQLRTGPRKFKVNPINSINAVIDTTFDFKENKAYSLFIAGVQPNISLVALKDSIHAPVTGKAVLRVINLSPDAPAVEISTTGNNSTAITASLGFKGITEYKEMAAGSHTLQIRGAGTEEVLLPNPSINLVSGRAYTLIIRGLAAAPAGNTYALDAQLILNY